MDRLIIFVTIVAGVLNIILFFKVWGMTTNVKTIKNFICEKKLSRKYIWLFVTTNGI